MDDSDTVGVEVATFLITQFSHAFMAQGRPETLRQLSKKYRKTLLPTLRNYHIASTNKLADMSVRSTRFSEAYNANPFEIGQIFVKPSSTA